MRKLLLLLLILPNTVFAWWNDAWPYRVPISVDTTATGALVSETVTEVPVLVRLHSGNFLDFFVLKGDLSDLRFIAGDDKTPLKHHVENFDLVNQMMFVWVRVPAVTSGLNTEKIWMYYGNEAAVSYADKNGTFNVNQVAVHHFEEPQGEFMDGTAYSNNAAQNTAAIEPASLVSAGLRFDGTQNLVLQDSASLRLIPDKGMTLSAWIKPAGVQQDAYLVYRQGETQQLILGIQESALYARLTTAQGAVETPGTAPLTPDIWQHVALRIEANRFSVFVNGAELASANASLTEMGGPVYIGSSPEATNGFVGELDEFRVENIASSTGWLQLAAKNQGQQDLLLRLEEGEQLGSGGGTSTFITILRHTTEDKFGLVVIIVLVIMSIISLIIMFMKGLYLNRVQKDNRAFLEAYYKLGAQDPTLLDREDDKEIAEYDESPLAQAMFGSHDHFQSSPTYHMYHRGIQEVKTRFASEKTGGIKNLNTRATESIRATMDAFMVREMQKLNAKMVLLTIAISGGPFLGLLGTVVGVMITFAAIAEAGDVNINAIAPGMSAALLATVAGLAVAIPALFGYNYLGSIIKDVSADMRVFVDEFVTRLAEYYGK